MTTTNNNDNKGEKKKKETWAQTQEKGTTHTKRRARTQTQEETDEKKKGVQHPRFPGGLPPWYLEGLLGLNCRNRTGSGVFPRVWPYPLALVRASSPLGPLAWWCVVFLVPLAVPWALGTGADGEGKGKGKGPQGGP